ncbi:ABC transporter permease [Allobaculum sp. JKK-2023]|uniref:ABC transporter permease n=1 Tax=Allobaculum sp. JKK-2023 TaxID=3108943 RepID=UPI002B058B56|nr:ABC transporter permease [Allobaculum sp. JKK-2023]
MSILFSLEGAIGQGILWGIMALGVYITFRLLDFADLTVDGSFATGGAVAAVMVMAGVNPYLAVLAAMLTGFAAGAVTGFFNTVCKIPPILAGILSQIGLYSINLMIMGQSNIPMLNMSNMFSDLAEQSPALGWITPQNLSVIGIGMLFVIATIALLYWFFGTELGSAIRATGNNQNMVRANGVSTNWTTIAALMLSNGLIALSGGLVAQQQGYADVKMGIGAIVMALASIVIGETIFGRKGGFARRLISIVVGSIIYRIIVSIVLQLGLDPNNLKLFTALLVAAALSIPVVLENRAQKANYKRLTEAVESVEDKF